ncbi:MAG: HAD family hydrolase [Thermoleophilaceae bacterium]
MSGHPPADLRAVVFDCDGLLLDTESRWTIAETALFERYGGSFGPEEKRMLLGSSMLEAGRLLERVLDAPGQAERLAEELLDLAVAELPGAEPMVGAIELVKELSGDMSLGLATNSVRRLIEPVLAETGAAELFDVVIAGDDVERAKPAPDIYLEMCRRLGVRPDQAIALEDSPNGVAAARSAGLFVIGVSSLEGVTLEANVVAPSLLDEGVRRALGL